MNTFKTWKEQTVYNGLVMKYASLVRIVVSRSVIIGSVNCTHAFNCWTVTAAACKHAAQQLVTVLLDLTSCLWACYWPETVISLSFPATPQRCRETDFAFLLRLTRSEYSICIFCRNLPSLISKGHQKRGALARPQCCLLKVILLFCVKWKGALGGQKYGVLKAFDHLH